MPKINKSRMINIKYNDDQRTIYNELFDYQDCKSMLYAMDNGIGKTVMIQFLMQPFIRSEQKRKLGKRVFLDYFNTNSPAIVMHEIKLDVEGAGYLLMGMIVRSTKDNDGKKKLKILAFTHFYQYENIYNIQQIPFIINENGRKKILSFQESEIMLKKAQKEVQSFKTYNFNDTTQKNDYFKELAEYRISYQEWEGLLRDINMDESGLSELYENSTTSEALIKKNILPAIEAKLNDDKNILEQLRGSLKKYIEKYVGIKHVLDKLQLFESFISDVKKLNPEIEQYTDKYKRIEDTENTLAYLHNYISNEIDTIQSDIDEYEKLKREALKDIENIEIEQTSYEIHELSAEISDFNETILNINDKTQKLENREKEVNKNIAIQNCAEEYPVLLEKKKKATELKERILNANKEDSEIQLNIKNYRYTLRELYSLKVSDLNSKLDDINLKISELDQNILTYEENLNTNRENQVKFMSQIQNNKNIIEDYKSVESVFIRNNKDFNPQKNLMGLYEEKDIQLYEKELDVKLNNFISAGKKLKDRILEIEGENKCFKKRKSTIDEENESLNEELRDRKQKLDTFNSETSKINTIFQKHKIDKDVVNNKEMLVNKIKNDIKGFKSGREVIQNEVFAFEKELKMIENCSPLDIPNNFKEALVDSGIEIKQGLKKLQDRNDSFNDKLELIKKNPLLPYSLLMNKEEMNFLKSISINTPTPIPIVDENSLNKGILMQSTNNLYTIGESSFYISFSEYLLDDNKREQKVKEINKEITLLKNQIKKIDNTINGLNLENLIIEKYPYKGNEDLSLVSEIKELNIKIANNLKDSIEFENLINKNSDELKISNERVIELVGEKYIFEIKIEKFKLLKSKYDNHLISIESNSDLEKKLKSLTVEEDTAKGCLSFSRQEHHDFNVKNFDCSNKLSTARERHKKYTEAIEGTLIEGELIDIEGALNACEYNYNSDLKRDSDALDNLTSDISQIENRIQRLSDKENINLEDYRDVQFRDALLKSMSKEIVSIQKELKDLKKPLVDTEKNKSVKEDNRNKSYDKLKSYGASKELPLEEIRNTNFLLRIKDQKKVIEECTEEVSSLNGDHSDLSIEIIKLKGYEDKKYTDLNICDLSINDIKNKVREYLNRRETEFASIELIRKEIKKEFDLIDRSYHNKHDVFSNHLKQLVGEENPIKIESSIKLLVDILERHIDTENTIKDGLAELEASIINEIDRYGHNVYEELATIDSNSAITINSTRKKMLQINLPVKENLNSDGIKVYIQTLIQTISVDTYMKDIDLDLSNKINAENLLSQLVGGLNRIKVQIYKIEKNGLYLKDWEYINHKNSGGEKFVSVFIVFTSLLSYTRKRPGDLQKIREGIILIMDNPFAKTQSEHLLVPMFEIAKKYNVQLICFSGIGGSAVYNRFDVIYMAKVINDKFSRKENIDFVNLANTNKEEDTLEVSSMVIEQQKLF